jgi:hypothetical protein
MAAWALFGATCSTWMFLRETLRTRQRAAVRVRRDR